MGSIRNLTLALAAGAAGIALAGPALALDEVTFGTNWVAEAEHGGFYQAVVDGTFSPAAAPRLYNCAIIFKRARGHGHIQRIEGLDRILGSFGEHIPALDLLPVGAHRRDWVKTLLSDGFVFVRHPDLGTTCELADRVGTELQMYAE